MHIRVFMILYVLFWCGGACSENMEIAASKAPGELLSWGDIQKMKLSWRVVQESMRIFPPTQGLWRVMQEDMSFDGFRIPKSWKVRERTNSMEFNGSSLT